MKTFKQYIKEQYNTFSAFMIHRTAMPQINDIESFIALLNELGINYVQDEVNPTNYRPTQVDFDQFKVDSIKSLDKPIIVSDDLFVLDGHHRYYKAIQDKTFIKAIIVNLPINKLLKLCLDQYKDSND